MREIHKIGVLGLDELGENVKLRTFNQKS